MVIKRLWKHKKNTLLAVLSVLAISGVVVFSGCSAGDFPEASKSRSRAVINSGDIVPAEEIRVAEYLQYYNQYFPEPEFDAIGLDLRLGNTVVPSEGGIAWLQIGLQTKSAESEFVAPLNLAIVVDRSGSMSDSDKMPLVKQSLRLFLESLNPEDRVALVTYSDHANIEVSSREIGDGYWIQEAVNNISTGGSTNLYDGLMVGFREVERHFDIHRNNRVMLLTDGIANEGETDPDTIAEDALAYNQKGIYLSTIGLGLVYNDPLLIKLADQGEGGYSFVDSAQEMDRIFREQVSSLKQRVADDVSVDILPGNGVRLLGVTGYDGTPPSEGTSVRLWPMSIEDSQVVLVELQISSGYEGPRTLARIRLNYTDTLSGRTVEINKSISAEMMEGLTNYDPTWDLEILRNVTIQQTAEGMQTIDRLFDDEKYEQAWHIAVDLEKQLTQVARLTNDSQMYEDAALMRKYQQTLSDAVYQTEGRTLTADEEDYTDNERPYRGDDDYPDLPEIEIK